jgi:hypothetical protein
MKSHIRMFAAVPTAHQPCGAKGVQCSVALVGNATATATPTTPTSTAESTSWKPEDRRRPNAFAPKTTAYVANATATATPVPEPVRSAT